MLPEERLVTQLLQSVGISLTRNSWFASQNLTTFTSPETTIVRVCCSQLTTRPEEAVKNLLLVNKVEEAGKLGEVHSSGTIKLKMSTYTSYSRKVGTFLVRLA